MSAGSMTTDSAAPAVAARGIQQPFLWLLGIAVLGLILRGWHVTEGLSVDEFTAVSAVLERRGLELGLTPLPEDPLGSVASFEEVSRRSVIPYGVRDPLPLYHGLLYALVQVLPPEGWVLRLPSLVAGLACLLVVFGLARAAFGTEVGLLAAALVALDPIQTSVSWLVRPYALANLACLLSFATCWGLVRAGSPARAGLCALGYGLCVAALGYLAPLMLFCVSAHAGMVIYALIAARRPGAGLGIGCWLAGLALAAVLLIPHYGYWSQVLAFAWSHSEYLRGISSIEIFTFFWHNLALLITFALAIVASSVVRWQIEGEGTPTEEGKPREEAPKPLEESPLPENEEAVWMSRLWVFVPQALVLVLAYVTAQSIFHTRTLSFTTLGGALLVAYMATRERSREVRLGVAAVLCLALLVLGFFWTRTSGVGLWSNQWGEDLTMGLKQKMTTWKEGDALLVRGGILEADLLHSADIPQENREALRRAVLAPLTTLYPDNVRRPVVALSLSQHRDRPARQFIGDHFKAETFYTEEFAQSLRSYKRYWLTGLAPGQRYNSRVYLASFLPWLADALKTEVIIARNREQGSPDRYLGVLPGQKADDDIHGLTYDFLADDFSVFVHMARPKQEGDKTAPRKPKETSGDPR